MEARFLVVDRYVEFHDFQRAIAEKVAMEIVFDFFRGRSRCVLELKSVLKPVLSMVAAGQKGVALDLESPKITSGFYGGRSGAAWSLPENLFPVLRAGFRLKFRLDVSLGKADPCFEKMAVLDVFAPDSLENVVIIPAICGRFFRNLSVSAVRGMKHDLTRP